MKLNFLLYFSIFFMTQVQAFQFPDQPLSEYKCGSPCKKLYRKPLQYSWPVSDRTLKHHKSNKQKSYKYKKVVTMADLVKGVSITALGPKAVIRISPINGKAIPPLFLKTLNGQQLKLKEASTLYSRDEAFADPDYEQKHQTVIQLKEEIGKGDFKLFSSKTTSIPENERFVISVYDKYSNIYLTVETDKQEYKPFDRIKIKITLNELANYPIEDISAYLLSPKGNFFTVDLKKTGRNQYEGSTILHSKINYHGENWYIGAEVIALLGDSSITRYGHTAFSYSIPSAKLTHLEKISGDPLHLKFGLKIAKESRYALQTVLFYKDNQGIMHPIRTYQMANWYKPGQQTMELTIDKRDIKQYDSPSLYLGYFHLLDYGQLKTIYHYDESLNISELG